MPDQTFTLAGLRQARAGLNFLNNGNKINNDDGACRFINERGFVLLMPVEGIPLPNISEADEDKPWAGFAITDRVWAWKETLPQRKLCAYTKLIHGRGTFISWRLYPSFLRIYGPDGDIDYEYENGRLDRDSRDLYKIVDDLGPINSRELWIRAKSLFNGKRSRFTTALERLQTKFFITVAGGSLEGWTLHTWDLVERQIPPAVLKTIPSKEEAMKIVLKQTIQNLVATSESKLRSILRFPATAFERTIDSLKKEKLITEVMVEGEKIPWLVIKVDSL